MFCDTINLYIVYYVTEHTRATVWFSNGQAAMAYSNVGEK